MSKRVPSLCKGHPRCLDWDGAEIAVASTITVFVCVHVCVFDRENSSVLGWNALCMKMPDIYIALSLSVVRSSLDTVAIPMKPGLRKQQEHQFWVHGFVSHGVTQHRSSALLPLQNCIPLPHPDIWTMLSRS